MTPRLIFVAVAFAMIAASPPPVTSREYTSMIRQLDQLCGSTGLRRIGELKITEGSQTHYRTKVSLEVDGKRGQFRVDYCRDRGQWHFCGFRPDDSVLDLTEADFRGFQYENDTLKDARLRSFAVRAVKKLNQHLRWRGASPPKIQKLGDTIVVTYFTVSAKELNRPGVIYTDPYVTFYVSPRGTVFAAYFGA